jgi:hypothetical protein
MPRKKSDPNQKKPALQFDLPVKKQKFSIELASNAADLIKGYPTFIEETTGAKPSVDEVIEKCVLKVLGNDKFYKEHLAKNSASGGSGNQRS